jgi:cytochrome d ubiquinol oxidase subunit I
MDILTLGRSFMGVTMAFHIAFALFGVGIPFMVSLAEFLGIVRRDADFTTMAKRWTFAMATLFVVGALSGTIVAVLFAVLLPPFMAIVSKVIILPFFIEGFAFFIEAIFLGVYAYTWDRWNNPWIHWLTSLPIVIGSCASAFLITTVNAFMNTPQGFTDANGVIANVHPWVAMFNAAVPTETSHSILAYYATTAFVFAAVAAMATTRPYRKKMLAFTMILALGFSLAVAATGDSAARFIAQQEPEKFAAAESVAHTQSVAPLTIGPIAIPGLLSILVGGSRNVLVQGLDSFDPATWPPLIVHYFFDSMVLIGILMLIVPLLFFLLWKRRPEWAFGTVMSRLTVATGVLSVVGIEVGWMLTELGRQPYVIRGVLPTSGAFTTSHAVFAYAILFPIAYVVLAALTFWILIAHYRAHNEY